MPYNPIPPRVWSRVQNICTNTTDTSQLVYNPYTKQFVTIAEFNEYKQMLSKGNILQYKKNSSNITKQQRYAQIAKGKWTNRTKSFATQSQTYTNPNISSLQRVNYTTIPFPNNIISAPNNIAGPFQYGVSNPFNCPTDSIEDGGSLVCNSYVNPCTGEIIKKTVTQTCYLTTDSDVPGIAQSLCWDGRLSTWYPRQRYTMNNSTEKWPVNYKGFVSALT